MYNRNENFKKYIRFSFLLVFGHSKAAAVLKMVEYSKGGRYVLAKIL